MCLFKHNKQYWHYCAPLRFWLNFKLGACSVLDTDHEARCGLSSLLGDYPFHGNDRRHANYSVISTVWPRCEVITGLMTQDCVFVVLTYTRTDRFLSVVSQVFFFFFWESNIHAGYVCTKESYLTKLAVKVAFRLKGISIKAACH